MGIDLNQFRSCINTQHIRDSDVISLTAEDEIKVSHRQLGVARWLSEGTVSRRVRNQSTVEAFIGSLRSHYGNSLIKRIDMQSLQELTHNGKPLRVRHIRAVLEKVDKKQLEQSEDMEVLTDQVIARSPYVLRPGDGDPEPVPGSQALVQEVRSKVCVATARQWHQENLAGMNFNKRALTPGEWSLATAKQAAAIAVADAQKAVFLSGYGVMPEDRGNPERLQRIIDRLPEAQVLAERHGIKFDAGRLPPALAAKLYGRLRTDMQEALRHPEKLPHENSPLQSRVEQKLEQSAAQLMSKFLHERTEALAVLEQATGAGKFTQATAASTAAPPRPDKLLEATLYSHIPASQVANLYALRNETPDNLAELAATGQSMEDRIKTLTRFGSVMEKAVAGLSPVEREKYCNDRDSQVYYFEDCGRFLMEGKIDDTGKVAIGAALRAESGSDLQALTRSVTSMNREALEAIANDSNDSRWGPARDHINRVNTALFSLQCGADSLGEMMPEDYSQGMLPVLTAMRNCSIKAPPPGNVRLEQTGAGRFSENAISLAQEQLREDCGESMERARDFPDFPAEPVVDYNRSTYIIDGVTADRTAAGVTARITGFCTGADGKVDEQLRETVANLAYQRTFAPLITHCFSRSVGDNAELGRAPCHGYPVPLNPSQSYKLEKTDTGDVRLSINFNGKCSHLLYDGGQEQVALDPARSYINLEMAVEIKANDNYSVNVRDMSYRFHFLPDGSVPM